MTEQLSPEELQRIHDEISGAAGPSVSSAIVNAEPSFTQTHPLTMAAISGELEPVAGLAQWIGIHEPARYLHGIEQEARATGRPGVGAAKMAGELGSLLLGGELSQGAKYAAETNPLMTGAITGGVTSAVMPTEMKEGENYSDFLKHKATDIAEGAALGGAFGKGSQLLFAPIVGKKVQALKDIGMTQFTPGQLLSDVPLIGPWIRGGEETLSSVPFLGDLIRGGRQNAVEDFNKAIANHVLSPMREATNQSTKVGHELADEVYNKVTNAYNEIAPELQLNAKFKNPETKQTTLATLNNALKDITSNLTPEDARSVTSAYKKFIIDPLKSDLTMDGVKFRQAESNLGKAAYSSYRKGNTDMGGAFRELQSHLRGVLAEQNPDKAAELSGIHESFKRWLRLEKAASKRGTEAGVFDPAQFASAVESLGGKNATARGKALMQEQADAAEAILGKKVPDSGTARRLMSATLLAGGPSMLAGIPMGPTLAALPAYSKLGMKYLTKFATERPKFDIFGKKIDMRELSPQIQTVASTAGGAEANNYKEGGLLDKFKKKSKKYAKGGIVKLAGGGTSEAFDQAKQNVIDTYETAKDLISNPTPYLNKFKQIPGIINDPAEPISHYLKGDISGGIARANEALSERSPEELAMGFAQPGAMGIVGSIENAGVKFTSPLKNTISSHKIESMPGSQWSSWLESNAPKSAKKEAEAIGLHDWIKEQPKLTKKDIHEYVDLNTPKINKTNLKQDAGELSPKEIERLNFLEDENTKNPLGGIDDIHGEGSYNELLRLQNIRDKSTVERLYAQQPILERWAREAESRGQNSDVYWDGINHLTARAEALDLQGMGLKDQTRFEQYTLPGGKDYNETTLTLPKPMAEYNKFSDMLKAKYGNVGFDNAPLTAAEKQTLENLYSKHDNGVYFPPQVHRYGEDIADANRLLHYRTNVRPTEDGKSALFLEELQSDWGQQGRDSGFGEGVTIKYDPGVEAYRAYDINGQKIELRLPNGERVSGLSSEEAVRKALPFSFYEKGVPHGPYVKDTKEWTQLGLKHALKDAIEQGHDYLTWTNGEQQVDRYKLSKFIKDLHYTPNEDGTYDIFASGHNGENVILEDDVPEHKLKDYVGKELAKKIVNDSGEPVVQDTGYRDWRKFSGVDLDVGSLGMKGYYDQILPQAMNDVLKQLGSKEKVQPIGIKLGEDKIEHGYSAPGIDYYGENKVNKAPISQQMGVRLTPELKQKILKEGIPKFKRGGLLAKFQK